MHKTARQKYVLDIITEQGQASITELADRLQVSADTIRRDLTDLEKQGLAQKNHGGAIALNLSTMNRVSRNTLLPEIKQRLGKQVAQCVPVGSTLFLDAGSTLLAVASFLQGPLTIITPSLDIAQQVSDREGIDLILLGGKWDQKQRLFAGSATLSLLSRYRADIAILGACAIHAELGLSASQEADAEVKRAMLAASQAHWVVADHLKLNQCEPYLVSGTIAPCRLPFAHINVEKVMNKVKTMNIALIGYGFVGKTFHAPLIQSVDGLKLAVISSRDEEKVKRDLPDVLVVAMPEEAIQHPDIDLVVIASPNATHAPLATLALNAGKHVVVDKPFTLDMQEARDLIALAEEKQLLLSVFHNRRWDSDFLGIKQVIAQGSIGKVKHFESHIDRFRPEVRVRWREQNVPGSGLWFDLGPHMIDQTLQLFGLPQSVQGNIATLRDGAEINDWAHVVLNYPEHKVVLHCSMLVAGGVSRFTIHGDKASVVKARIDQQEAQLLAGVIPGSESWGEDSDAMVLLNAQGEASAIPAPKGDQRQYYINVRDALNGKIDNPVPPVEALAVMAVLEAAVKSSETGTTQELDLTAQERAQLQ